MTRTTDETLSPTERVNRVLNAFGNDSDVLVISNHINAGGSYLALARIKFKRVLR